MSSQIEEIGIRIRSDGVVELTNGARLSAAAVDQLGQHLDKARKPMDSLGESGGRTAASLGGLPAELTRVVSALATGDAAMASSALAGGQLQSTLLSLSPAAELAVGALAPVAAAVGLMTVAYVQGGREQDIFFRSMVNTGNAAGVTMGQMVSMAQGIDRNVSTQARASEVLGQLAASAVVAGQDMQKFGEIALTAERTTGQAAEDMVKQLVELGKAPVQASIKLNETTNYLTTSLYEQIRALQQQGRLAEAASVAQNAWADATAKRTAELDTRLGLLERSWRAVKEAAKDAWDAMRGLGREKNLEEQLATAEKQLAEMPEPRRGTNTLQATQRRETLRQHVEDLRMQIYMQGESAAADANAAESTKRYIAEREKATKATRSGNDALAERIALMTRIYGGTARGAVSADEAQRAFRQGEIRGDAAMEKFMAQQRAQATADHEKALKATATAAERDATAVDREMHALANSTAEIGLNEAALLSRRQALLDNRIAEAAALLSVVEGAEGHERQTAALHRQISALQQMKDLNYQAASKTADVAAAKAQEQEQADNQRRAQGMADSLEQGIINGYRNGQRWTDIFVNELKAQFARTVLRPIIEPIASMMSGGGSGGIFGALLDVGKAFLAPSATSVVGATGDFARMDRLAGIGSHAGGVQGVDSPTFNRMLPASTWAGAPRFHTGIGPDEIPAILQRKEGVFTEGQMKAMAPVSELAKAGGNRINFAPTINIDSRTDRAEVAALVQGSMRQSQAELLEMMDRRMV